MNSKTPISMVPEEAAVQLMQRYVPPLIVRQIFRDRSPINRPKADRITAAVLFADITNFTALSGKFVESNISAAEELAILLNRFFNRLITIVHDHGGEVTKFAGDALIALWPVPESTIRFGHEARKALIDAVDRAINCSYDIQKNFPQEPIEGLKVSVEIGIGAGDVYSVYLGGILDRWEFLLSGSPLIQMSKAINNAVPGDIVLSSQAWELVGGKYTGQAFSGGYVKLGEQNDSVEAKVAPELQLPSNAIEAIKPFIPAAIISRLDAGMTGWLSELRRVSVIFILLPGYGASITHPFERTLPEAQRVMQALQEALYRFGGSINKLNVDDKGITLVAAFGLPPFSHPDDAAKAVHSALLMQSELDRLNRPSSIGITTGWVYCGPIGNTKRSEYTLVGDEVNLATRLMQLAEAKRLLNYGTAELVCDETTYLEIDEQSKKGDLLARQLSFGQKKVVKVKGRTGLVEIYQPHMKPWIDIVRKQYSIPNKGTLVGRHDEMDQIRDLIREVDLADRGHRGQLVVVEGEAGMGKTFFIGEIQRQEANSGRILISGGQRLQQTSDYHTWKPIFQQLYGIESQDNVELRKAKVLAKLPYMPGERGYPALARDLSSLLNPVLSVRFPETPTTKQLDPGTRKRIRKDFLLRLLQIAAAPRGNREKAARFIIIEDVQWMDKASWDLTLEALNSVRPLLLLLTMRPLNTVEKRQLPKSAGLVLNNKEAAWIRLEGFTSEQINKLVSQSIGVNEITSNLIEFLQEKTGGHPQLCKELAINLREKGLIDESASIADLNVAVSVDDRHVVPIEIHKSVIGRFDQLSAPQQMILKIATLAEQSFTAEIIRKGYPINIDEGLIGRYMDDLERTRFLRHTPSGSGERLYRFDNTIVRDEIRSLLPNKQKREIQSLITMAS